MGRHLRHVPAAEPGLVILLRHIVHLSFDTEVFAVIISQRDADLESAQIHVRSEIILSHRLRGCRRTAVQAQIGRVPASEAFVYGALIGAFHLGAEAGERPESEFQTGFDRSIGRRHVNDSRCAEFGFHYIAVQRVQFRSSSGRKFQSHAPRVPAEPHVRSQAQCRAVVGKHVDARTSVECDVVTLPLVVGSERETAVVFRHNRSKSRLVGIEKEIGGKIQTYHRTAAEAVAGAQFGRNQRLAVAGAFIGSKRRIEAAERRIVHVHAGVISETTLGIRCPLSVKPCLVQRLCRCVRHIGHRQRIEAVVIEIRQVITRIHVQHTILRVIMPQIQAYRFVIYLAACVLHGIRQLRLPQRSGIMTQVDAAQSLAVVHEPVSGVDYSIEARAELQLGISAIWPAMARVVPSRSRHRHAERREIGHHAVHVVVQMTVRVAETQTLGERVDAVLKYDLGLVGALHLHGGVILSRRRQRGQQGGDCQYLGSLHFFRDLRRELMAERMSASLPG